MIFRQFTTNEIKPTGWLKNQLEIQANGLSGNLDKMWNSIKNSSWIGGSDEGWERVPYWLDGFVPLAYLLENKDMQARTKKYIDAILERQCEDGWICPCDKEQRTNYDIWACFIICKALVVYADCSGDERIENAVSRALQNLSSHINGRTLFDWGSARWFECLIPILWLRERKAEDWQLDLVDKLYIQGIDYKKMFKSWRYAERRENWSYLNHVVNIAMMLKGEALMTEFRGGDANEFAKEAMEILLRDHGMACGHFTGDECLSGTSPVHGTESCSVAEAMYSYEWLVALTGDSYWSERLEKTTFNAFPATVSPDMWTHQYDQMTNQVQCVRFPDGKQPFNTNSEESHLFGLEPNFGCCTANFNQAFPKFAMSTMMKTENGIAICAVAPSKVETVIGGAKFSVEIVTGYPFEDGYKIKVKSDSHDERELLVRIPEKAVNATIDGKNAGKGFVKVSRDFFGEIEIDVRFSFDVELTERPSGLFCAERGNLVFSLPIGERWEKREYTRDGVERKFPYCDYEIFPTTDWNYGFCTDDFTVNFREVGKTPFSPDGAPIRLTAKMAEVDWKMSDGRCEEIPVSKAAVSEPVEMTLIPYGCTNLRMTEMPKIENV